MQKDNEVLPCAKLTIKDANVVGASEVTFLYWEFLIRLGVRNGCTRKQKQERTSSREK
jgi:hypothetical protein